MATEVLLPKMGESVAEATITKWLKSVGEQIEEEESLVEIATDKVDSEVPSPISGVIKEIKFQEGEVAQVGDIIAVIASENGGEVKEVLTVESKNKHAETPTQKQPEESKIVAQQIESDIAKVQEYNQPRFDDATKFYSPLVKSIAKKENIGLEELERINGSGKDGRVTKKDVLSYVENRSSDIVASPVEVQSKVEKPLEEKVSMKPVQQTVDRNQYEGKNVEIIEMDRMRKLIADHMVSSKHTSPHVTSFVEADVTDLVKWRDKIKDQFFAKEKEKITFTPIFIEAVVKALKDFPMVNVSVDGGSIIKKNYVNIGVATALPSGNLIVPVVKNADYLNLTGLAKSVNDLVARARINKLKPDEIQDGTFTLTNVGTFGNLMGTPIINQPQVAIMATGSIKKKPAVIETPQGDHIAIRHMMYLSLSYDHRVVDGALGGSFLRRVADYLEKFDANRTI